VTYVTDSSLWYSPSLPPKSNTLHVPGYSRSAIIITKEVRSILEIDQPGTNTHILLSQTKAAVTLEELEWCLEAQSESDNFKMAVLRNVCTTFTSFYW
jgi:hypothetical protein